MAFEFLASLSLPGNSAKPNDDFLAHRDGAAVVMDGATGLGENLLPGASDAAWLAQFGCRRLMAHMQDGDGAQAALAAALTETEHSFKALRKRPPAENYEIPFASMMFVATSAGGFDAMWFGDCAALVKRPGEAVLVVGDAFEKRAREAERVARLARAQNLAPAAGFNRNEYLPALRRARNSVNSEGGGWLFGPDARASDHVAFRRVQAGRDTLVLLASDGFLALASDYGKYDAEGLLAAAQGVGLARLGEELRAVEDADPEGRRYPRFKKSDDATALLLRIA